MVSVFFFVFGFAHFITLVGLRWHLRGCMDVVFDDLPFIFFYFGSWLDSNTINCWTISWPANRNRHHWRNHLIIGRNRWSRTRWITVQTEVTTSQTNPLLLKSFIETQMWLIHATVTIASRLLVKSINRPTAAWIARDARPLHGIWLMNWTYHGIPIKVSAKDRHESHHISRRNRNQLRHRPNLLKTIVRMVNAIALMKRWLMCIPKNRR